MVGEGKEGEGEKMEEKVRAQCLVQVHAYVHEKAVYSWVITSEFYVSMFRVGSERDFPHSQT